MRTIKNFYRKYLHNWVGFCVAVAFSLNIFIETLARQNFLAGFIFFFESPMIFLYNCLLIFATLSVTLLFKRRVFFLFIISMIWVALGITNGFILRNRMTPFTVFDLVSIKDALSIATNYLSKIQIFAGIAAIIFLMLFIIFVWRKAPKKQERPYYKKDIIAVVGTLVITFFVSQIMILTGTIDTYFPNLAYGYRDNGVCYCFINTWLNTGVARPEGYSEAMIKDIFTEKELKRNVANRDVKPPKKRPNIVFVQLESLMDPLTVKGMKYTKDPIPNLRKLYKTTSSGRITVPAMGAGTANTEFESMTGMSIKFFGPGEYPYKNIMRKKTVESIPYDLKAIGYKAHAIHNHRGVFYGRNEVFPHMGYDTFTSIEYMNNVARTPKNWSKDFLLTGEVLSAMKSTRQPDYVYAISVQGHGKYPTNWMIASPDVQVTEAPSEDLKWQYEYYINQIYEMDRFVKEFIDAMKKFKEDTVVVMYGDHLPALENLTDDNLKYGRNNYQTDYFIWSNFPMKKIHKDLYCYQIGAELLDRLGIHNGTLISYHQNHQKDKKYLRNLEALQHDMLYGKYYIYDKKNPFKPVKMKMGVKDIKVHKVVIINGKYYIKGQNFTEWSKINLDGKILKTFYLGPEILGLSEEVDPGSAKRMKVSQVEKNNEILSTTE